MVSINPLKQKKTMKKYIFMAVAGMLALSSCSNDENDIQDAKNAPRQMTFTAGYNEGAQTRATMDFSTKKVSFDANECQEHEHAVHHLGGRCIGHVQRHGYGRLEVLRRVSLHRRPDPQRRRHLGHRDSQYLVELQMV